MNFSFIALTATAESAVNNAGEGSAVALPWSLYNLLMDALGINGGSNQASLLFLGGIVVCMLVAYLIGSINPAIIISKLKYHEDIRSFGSGNAGTTNTLRTYGKRMAILIFSLDLIKAALAVILGTLILTKSIGGAVAALFVVLGHMFPVYYKFKGGKGVACAAMCMLLLSPASFLIIIVVFITIAALTRFISLGSVICAMLYPFLNHVFYANEGWITLSAFVTAAMVVFMHRENIKRLMAGKESKFSFKKTDKHKAEEHEGVTEAPKAPQREYSDDDFVKCACGRIIPKSRRECVYCGEKNSAYVPKIEENVGKKKKK